MIFVDEKARVYKNWDDYLKNNRIPKAIIIAPKCGIYCAGILGHVLLDICSTPACSPGNAIIKYVDIGTSIAAFGTTCVVGAGILSAPVTVPVMIGASAVGVTCGAYSLIRSGILLNERHNYEQSISFTDTEARNYWLSIIGGLSSVAASGAVNGLAYLVRDGQEIGLALRTTINVLNTAAIATNGAGVVNGFFNIYIVSIFI